MANVKGLEWTFNTVPVLYENMRPGYTDALYQRIFDYIPVNASSNVAEVGIGAGQATLPILQTGCKLTAIEYGERLSALCREKFKDYPNFSVITGKFEDVDFKPASYDLVFSASAFHWIPEEIGYPKVFSMLKSGGVFARFANHPFVDKGRKELCDEIQKLYAVYMNSTSRPVEYSRKMAEKQAEIASAYGFERIECELYQRKRTFSAKEYTALLGTYSDHIALEESKRMEFFLKIEHAINRYGGVFTIYDTMDLQLAKKP